MKITINNVRLSYSSLWEKTDYKGDGKFRYKATFLIPKDHPQIPEIEKAINSVATEKYGVKAKNILTGIRNNHQKFSFRDGDTKPDADGYPGHMFISSGNKATKPAVFDNKRGENGKLLELTKESGRPYDGCWVDASVDFYCPVNNGPAVFASLRGVRWRKDGDAFAGGSPASEEEFDDLADGADTEFA